MRIIGGKLRGLRINPPANLPVRPTTDLAKEALFNILNNLVDLEDIKVLDLFSGTGSISLEFASRGAIEVVSVDKDFNCCKFQKQTAEKLQLTQIDVNRTDTFKFLEVETNSYDIIFADPPFDKEAEFRALPALFRPILAPQGMAIIQFPTRTPPEWVEDVDKVKRYGESSLAFFNAEHGD